MSFSPKFTITPLIMETLLRISEIRVKIETASVAVPWIPRLSKDAFNRLAHSSTAIEGNPLTLKEVELLAKGKDLPQAKPRYKSEVTNYLAALRYVADRSKKPITEKDILRLHEIVGAGYTLEREPVGEYRDYQVVVGSHRPPKAKDVPGLMAELLEWINGDGKTMPAVVASAAVHYQFEHIHPFGDGNGRVGRLIATWILYQRQFDTHHIFSVDELFWEKRQEYYKALENIQKSGGDMSAWIEYVADAVLVTLERVWKRVQAIGAEEKSGGKLVLTGKQERLLTLLNSEPMGIADIMRALKVTKPGAHFIIKPLLQYNIIVKKGGYKTGKYTIS